MAYSSPFAAARPSSASGNQMTSGLVVNPKPKTKTAYNLQGQPVEIGEGMPVSQWKPDTGYSGGQYFEAPPPQQQQGAGGGMGVGSAPRMGTPGLPSLPPPSSMATYSQSSSFTPNAQTSAPAYETQQQTLLEAQLRREEDERRAQLANQQRQQAMSAFSSMSGSLGGGGVAGPSEEDLALASSLEYGKAKDQIGMNRLAAIREFQDMMSGRGLAGSTIEGEGAGAILSGAGQELGDVALNQAQGTVNRKYAVADRAAEAEEARRSQMLGILASMFNSSGSLY